MVNCTFAYNTAKKGYYGGGLYNDGTATLVRSTFSHNTAAYGGGVYNFHSATINLGNTIVAGNTASDGGPDIYADVDSEGNNLIGNTSDSKGWGNSDVLNQNPLLSSLGNYGGPTPDHGDCSEQPCQVRRQPRLLSHFGITPSPPRPSAAPPLDKPTPDIERLPRYRPAPPPMLFNSSSIRPATRQAPHGLAHATPGSRTRQRFERAHDNHL